MPSNRETRLPHDKRDDKKEISISGCDGVMQACLAVTRLVVRRRRIVVFPLFPPLSLRDGLFKNPRTLLLAIPMSISTSQKTFRPPPLLSMETSVTCICSAWKPPLEPATPRDSCAFWSSSFSGI